MFRARVYKSLYKASMSVGVAGLDFRMHLMRAVVDSKFKAMLAPRTSQSHPTPQLPSRPPQGTNKRITQRCLA